MSSTQHMNAGHSAMAEGRFDEAFDQFFLAHQASRHIRAEHLAAHRAMMQAARHGRHPRRYLTHLALWGASHLTRNHPIAKPTPRQN